MNATTTTKKLNVPAYEVFLIEERAADPAMAAKKGRTLAENAVDRIWHKVGVAFETAKGNANILIGPKGDPAQKRFLLVFSSHAETNGERDHEARRRPAADIFASDGNGDIDFQSGKVGVAFFNRDESLSLVIGDRGDLEQLRYQMRRITRRAAPAPTAGTTASTASLSGTTSATTAMSTTGSAAAPKTEGPKNPAPRTTVRRERPAA